MQGRNRDADLEQGLVDTTGKGRVKRIERVALTYIPNRVKRTVGQHRELSAVLCDTRRGGMGRKERGRSERERIYVSV